MTKQECCRGGDPQRTYHTERYRRERVTQWRDWKSVTWVCLEGRGPRNQAQKEVGPDPGKSLPHFREDFHCPLSFKSHWGAVSSNELWWELWSRNLFCWWVKNGSERSKSEGGKTSIAVILARSDSNLD